MATAYPWLDSSPENLKSLTLELEGAYFLKSQKKPVFTSVAVKYKDLPFHIDLGAEYSFIEKKVYPRLSELAVTLPLFSSEEWVVSLGVKKHFLSESDIYWNLGLWQPRYLVDLLRPEQMGLPGLFFIYEGLFDFTLYASYVHLPDIVLIPDFDENQGMQSKNPFFHFPGIASLKWNVKNKSDLFKWKTFLKPSVALNFRHEMEFSQLSLSYAYKPINQFQYSVLVDKVNLSQFNYENVIKDYNYSLGYHHLISLDAKIFPMSHFSFLGTLIYEYPEKLSYPSGWVYDNLESHLVTNVMMTYKEGVEGVEETLVTFGFIKLFESNIREEKSNSFTEDFEFIFGREIKWKNALSVSVEYKTKKWLYGYHLKFRLNHSLLNENYLASFENQFFVLPALQFYVSGDLIFKLFDDPQEDDDTPFMNRYKDLSRFLTGVRYVF